MRGTPLSAVALSLLLLLPGCISPFGDQQEQEIGTNCQEEPSTEGCFEDVITEDDCTSLQVFAGDYCRTMLRPELLDFGVPSISLEVGEEMQPLTPSFVGDAPSNWAVNPTFPEGIYMHPDTGVISGNPSVESNSMAFTIIASNAAGQTAERIRIEVLATPPGQIQYPQELLQCTIGEGCTLPAPSLSGGEPSSWTASPSLPFGLGILPDGTVSGTTNSASDSNHTISAHNSGGTASTSIRVISLPPAPASLDYGSQGFILTYGAPFSIIPSFSGGDPSLWQATPDLPEGLTLAEKWGNFRSRTNTAGSRNLFHHGNKLRRVGRDTRLIHCHRPPDLGSFLPDFGIPTICRGINWDRYPSLGRGQPDLLGGLPSTAQWLRVRSSDRVN